MAAALPADVLQDEVAVSVARIIASANRRATDLGVDVLKSLVTITERVESNGTVWRVNYGPRDYIGRRGGDLVLDLDPRDASVTQVLWGQ